MDIQTIVFDLGGVLIDWNPRYLYRKLLKSDAEIESFLKRINHDEWNGEQDAGRSFGEAIALLKAQHPEDADLIDVYQQRWEEMLGGAYEETVEILRAVKKSGLPVYALTNWSAETFPIARQKFGFLQWFDGILVSGEEKLRKPDIAIFRLMLERFPIDAGKTVYIDDVAANIVAAQQVGLRTIHFQNATQLRAALHKLDVL